MALFFTDEIKTTAADLAVHDSGVMEAARLEQIDLTSKLALARDTLRIRLANQLGEGQSVEGVAASLELERWHIYATLEHVYRDAYFSQLNDRYGEKWKLYRRLAEEAEAALGRSGVGLIANPLPQPPEAALALTAGNRSSATYFVQVSRTGAGGRESEPSAMTAVSGHGPHGIVVGAPPEVAGATGWNVYAGYTADSLTRQNDVPLAPGEEWVMPVGGLVEGPSGPPTEVQETVVLSKPLRLLRRG
jgi:hypothetical protein